MIKTRVLSSHVVTIQLESGIIRKESTTYHDADIFDVCFGHLKFLSVDQLLFLTSAISTPK